MKIYKTLILVALILPVSCQKESPGSTGLRMRVEASLASETKGSLTTADLTDFYLQVVSDDAAYSYLEHASKDGSGVWKTPMALFWKDETTPVSYCAARFGSYSFTADEFKNGVDLQVPADQGTQEQLNAADLLTMPAASKKFTDTAGGTLPVALSHGLAKVSVTLTLGPKFYDNNYTRAENPVKDFTVSGTNLAFTFQPQTGAVSATADTKADILALAGVFTPGTAESKSATATYEAILVPQTLAAGALKLTFKVGDYGYEWSNAAAITLETGKTYDLAVSVTTAPPVDPYNGHAYVDMGNGLKWGTCNVGADNPWEYGDYFAWGETTTKDTYNWSTYIWGDGTTFTKYTVDGTTVLEAADDAAAANWGGNWRTPTDAEWTWLRENCDWAWTDDYLGDGSNKAGRIVTNTVTGNQIFLPAAGYWDVASLDDVGSNGYYWSSSLYENSSVYARSVYFGSGGVLRSISSRFFGQSVRPVAD